MSRTSPTRRAISGLGTFWLRSPNETFLSTVMWG